MTRQAFADRGSQMRNRVAASVFVLTSTRFASRALDFVTLVVLARQLTPADFGLVAIAMSVVQITEAVLELPTGNALLQLKAIGRSHLDTAFTLAALRGLLLTALLCALSFPLALFFGDERLIALICALSIAPAVRALRSPKSTLAFKHLKFRPDALSELVGKSCALAIAVSLALATESYWAIAAGSIASAVFYVLASYVMVPMRPRLTLRHWRIFHSYLAWSMAGQTVSALNWQTDRFILGKLASQATVGLFATLRDLAAMTYKVLFESIQRPLVSALARSQGDRTRQQAAYGLSIGSLLSIGLPVAVGQAILAPEIILLVLGPKWEAGVFVYQVVSLTLLFGIFSSSTASLLYAIGRPSQIFRRNLIDLAFRVPATVIGIFAIGWKGAVWALFASDLFLAALCIHVVRSEIGLGIFAQISKAWRGAAGAVAMVLVVEACRPFLPRGEDGLSLIGFLVGGAGIGATTYVFVHWLAWRLAGRPDGIEGLAADSVAKLRLNLSLRMARSTKGAAA